VVLALIAVMLLLRWRKAGAFAWTAAWWVGLYVAIRYGFVVPVPASLVTLYMAIVSAALLAYVSSDRRRWQEFTAPLLAVMLQPRFH
jgi:hypothetical protein